MDTHTLSTELHISDLKNDMKNIEYVLNMCMHTHTHMHTQVAPVGQAEHTITHIYIVCMYVVYAETQ
jgi:hypothetical protein